MSIHVIQNEFDIIIGEMEQKSIKILTNGLLNGIISRHCRWGNTVETIEIILEEGSASGYVVNAEEEQVENWFLRHKIDGSALKRAFKGKTLAFLNNMYVEEGGRGNGVGTDLLSQFIDAASLADAEAIILICDHEEDQADGFKLQDWYEDWEFEVTELIEDNIDSPVMIKFL